MHTFQITIFIKSARYFVPKTKTVVIYKTTHQSGLRKHPKDTILVQMRGKTKERKKEKLQNVILLFRLRVFIAIVIKTSCLYTHAKSHRQRETQRKRLIITSNIFPNCQSQKTTRLQLSTTVQHNSPRGNLSSKRKLENDIRTKYLNKIG